MFDHLHANPIRYATELELCREHRDIWLAMQSAIEANDTQAVKELAKRLDEIVQSLEEGQ